jgi:hypothetical protein
MTTPDQTGSAVGRFFGTRGAFVLIAGLAFAGCFMLSELGRAKHWQWLMGWPPLLFIFTVPPEYRWRFTGRSWVRDVFVAMTTTSCMALAISTVAEVAIYGVPIVDHQIVWSGLAQLLLLVVFGGLLFGALSLFSAWGLYSVFYRPDGPASRGRTRPPRDDH